MQALPPNPRPERCLRVVNGVADGGGELLFARPADFRPAIAAAPPSGSADLHVRRNEVSGTYDVLVQPFAAAEQPASFVY